MIDPIGVLLEEHRTLMQAFAPLRRAVRDLGERGDDALEDARPELAAVARIMATDLLAHARKEDEALFPALEAVFGSESTPTAAMRAEHASIHAEAERFRRTLHELNEVEHPAIVHAGSVLQGLVAGRADAGRLRATAERILELVDAHFQKEETVLFPMACAILTPEALADVGRRMEALAESGTATGR